MPLAHPSFVAAPDGVRLAVYEWGKAEGPELVLIHGFSQCHLSFARQIESALARQYRIIAYDMRGHGASEKPPDPRAYQGQDVWARDLVAVLEAKRLKRPMLVGWSMGGRVIRQYLMAYGDARIAGINLVGSLVIEDPAARGPGAEAPRPSTSQPLAQQIEAAIAFLDHCFAIKPTEAEFRLALGYNMLIPVAVREAISQWSTDPADTIAALQRVRVPTLITHGRKDAIILPKAAEMTASAVPGSRLSWYEECGHSPFFEAAARFNEELAAFMASVA
jgi:non-heme chloroperoxidase